MVKKFCEFMIAIFSLNLSYFIFGHICLEFYFFLILNFKISLDLNKLILMYSIIQIIAIQIYEYNSEFLKNSNQTLKFISNLK